MEIYVHIPFCLKKCKYCDFISFSNCEDKTTEYFDKLRLEIEEKSKKYSTKVTSIYFGGGTPTLPTANLVCETLEIIKKNFFVCDSAEITIEGNPKTFSEEKLVEYKKAGFNRFSVGIQSFDEKELTDLGRAHTSLEGENALKIVSKYFPNYSIDLMIGLQDQTPQKIKNSMDKALLYNPTHISCYMLIDEEGTLLHREIERGQYLPKSEEETASLYKFTQNYLEEKGFLQYEISNFCKNNLYSQHNLGYWNMTDYLGLGLNAHSLIGNRRFYNTHNFEEYLSNPTKEYVEENLTINDIEKEYIMLSLRTTFGVDLKFFNEKFKKDFKISYEKQLNKLNKLLNITNINVSIKKENFLLSNGIIVEFM